MINEQIVADAILQLKNESNIFKDYLFPISLAFFSSFLGGLLGYLIYRQQERIALEKNKLDIANKWIINAYSMQQKLLSIKANYYKHLLVSTHPLDRVFKVPPIVIQLKNYEFNYFELIPILDGNNQDKYNVGNLGAIFDNYINVFIILNKRNELYTQAIDQLKDQNIQFEKISYDQILKSIDKVLIFQLIDFNEILISLIDDLVIELTEFMKDFPKQVSKAINLKMLKQYAGLAKFDFEVNRYLDEILKEIPKPDFQILSEITQRPIEELMARYKPLFRNL